MIHSMVEYADGSVLAQLGNPDMRTPIAHALAWPERIDSGVKALDLFDDRPARFRAPRPGTIPVPAAGRRGRRAPAAPRRRS
ncbi:MAG: hypothetical protein MZV65_16905 [Chromatiales bacterium]|nr:hypothetical protein [Chromatiales bacterium]